MWSTPWMNPLAIDGAAPSTTTNVIASSVSLNSSTASGNHAIEGMVWRPMISEPTAERMTANARHEHADRRRRSRRRSPKPQMARRSVITIAVQSSGVAGVRREAAEDVARGREDVGRPTGR